MTRFAADIARKVVHHCAWHCRTRHKKTGLRTRSITSVYDGRIKFPLGWHASMNEGGTCRRNGSQSTGRGNERLRKRPTLRANAKRYLSGFRHRQSPDKNDDDLCSACHYDDPNDEYPRVHQFLEWQNNTRPSTLNTHTHTSSQFW